MFDWVLNTLLRVIWYQQTCRIQSESPYSAQIHEDTEQKKFQIRTFSNYLAPLSQLKMLCFSPLRLYYQGLFSQKLGAVIYIKWTWPKKFHPGLFWNIAHRSFWRFVGRKAAIFGSSYLQLHYKCFHLTFLSRYQRRFHNPVKHLGWSFLQK